MRVIKNIGQGGFGSVDLVETVDGDRLARKTFCINQMGAFPAHLAENVKRRFSREATIQSAFKHPNIMPVVSADLDADPPSFLMPLATASLADDMDNDRQLGGRGLSAIMDILAGLEELHTVEIYHRDLKPHNVMRFDDEGVHRYVIGDVGLISVNDTRVSVLTQTGMRMGSDMYTAPEIVKELGHASAASDIFSVGCILHDMFGEGPDRLPCSEVTDDRGPFSEVIRICTRKDPRRRFADVAALRDAILSVDLSGAVATEPQVDDFVQLLNSDEDLNEEHWEAILRKLRQIYPSPDASVLLTQIPVRRLEQLVEQSPELSIALSTTYTEWAKSYSFDFNLCDGIANRLEAFLAVDNVTCATEVRLALLHLGTSHNRWYVERKFAKLSDRTMDGIIAKRLAMELRALGAKTCRMIDHLEGSISFDRADLHPLLVETLRQVCK